MIAAVVLLLLQAPSLSEAYSEALSGEVPRTLTTSAAGTWLVLGMEDRLEIRDSKTLKQVRTIPLRWTEFGFDEGDSELLVIGEEATRFRTKDWSIRFRQPLTDAAFAITKSMYPVPTDDGKTKHVPLLTGQALVLPDLDFYYRTKGGGMSMGSWNDGKLTSTPVALDSDLEQVHRILGLSAPGQLLLTIEGENLQDRAAVASLKKLNAVGPCRRVLGVRSLGDLTAFIGSTEEVLFDASTWKVLASRSGQSNLCVAGPTRSGWIFVSGSRGIRAWQLRAFSTEKAYSEVSGPVRLVEVDPRASALFTVEDRKLRRWQMTE